MHVVGVRRRASHRHPQRRRERRLCRRADVPKEDEVGVRRVRLVPAAPRLGGTCEMHGE